IEILQTHIVDKKSGERHAGIVGNNFSSYVRDYDFSVLLLPVLQARANVIDWQIDEKPAGGGESD
ncbi:putative oxygenase MesX, partial [Acinetobacter baumannii]|uniref:putative oxygenase MesX n=1 Tax=Acinetobacter baumannii TaxID=470 RepID=UPI003AFFF6D4